MHADAPGRSNELAVLRRRAYGADADIDGDPAALARLRALEQQQLQERQRAASDVPAPESHGAEAVAAREAEISAELAEISALAGSADHSTAPPAISRVGIVLACAAAALLSAALAVPLTLWATGLSAQPDVVLHPVSDAAALRYFDRPMTPDSLRYDDFYGLQLAVGAFEDSAGDGTCILAVIGPDSGNGSCSPDPLDPIFDLAAANATTQLRNRFGDDAVLRFVVVGDELHVFVSHPTSDEGIRASTEF